MFFPISAEETSKALGQIRRLRHAHNLHKIGSSDIYWSAPFLAALVDVVDSLLIEKPEHSFELSAQGILLAERIRPESCPGRSDLGKRSLCAWTQAVHGSSCRALERYPEAEAAFQKALGLVGKKVHEWAAAEVWRRYAALLLFQGSLAGLDFVNRAFENYAGFPAAQADALVLRGLFHQYLEKDLAAAVQDMNSALKLIEAKRSPREARTWSIAIDNLSVLYSRHSTDLATVEASLKNLRQVAQKLSRHEPLRRMACLSLQALMLVPLGSVRKAEKLLVRSISWNFRSRHYLPACIWSVDLARIHFLSGETAAAEAILEGLPAAAADADPKFLAHLQMHLALFRSKLPGEASFEALRDAVASFNRYRPEDG